MGQGRLPPISDKALGAVIFVIFAVFIVVIVVLAVLASQSGSSSGSDTVTPGATGTFTEIPPQEGTPRIVLVNPATNTLEIQNQGLGTVDVSQWQLCANLNYVSLEAVAKDPTNNANPSVFTACERLIVNWTLNDAGSELGLYSSTSFASADAMQDYVVYGSPASRPRETVAVTANLWTASTAVTGAEPFTFVGDAKEHGVQFWEGA